MEMLATLAVPAVLLLVAALKSFGINQEYERAVVFRLGRIVEPKGPGWYWLVPFVDRAARIDIRTITYALDTQETVTRDGVQVRVNAVIWFRATNPTRVVTAVDQWQKAVIQAGETGLRDAIGQSELDQLLKDRAAINERLMGMLGRAVEQWGVAIDAVELKDLDIPESMQRAIAREAEAVREKRARIIRAEGERESAEKLSEAAAMISASPGALELRRLQTLADIGTDNNSTIVAMFPTELLEAARAIGMKKAE